MSDLLPTCAEFRVLSRQFQSSRRSEVYPHLDQRRTALLAEIKQLQRQRDSMKKHDRQHVESTLTALWWELQGIYGQLTVIESEAING